MAGWDAEDHPQSVKTGRTNDDVKADRDALWNGQAPAAAAEIDLTGRGRGADAALHRTDAGDARLEAVQRPGLAVRDQVGRVSRPGRRRWREGQDLDPRPQGRRDLLPAAAVAGLVDRCQAGDRRWRGRGPRRGRPAGLLAAPDQARPDGASAASSTRRSTCSISTAGSLLDVPLEDRKRLLQSVLKEPPAGPLRGARRGRGRGVLRGGAGQSARGHHRQAAPEPVRAGAALQGLAEAQGPARAGAGDRRLDARRGQRARPRCAGRRLLRGRQAAVRRQGRVGVHRRDAQGAAGEAQAAGDRRLALSTRRRPRTTRADGAATSVR